MADGFLGRWAQRKQAVREGKTIEEPVRPTPQAAPAGGSGREVTQTGRDASIPPLPPTGEGRGEGDADTPPPPTLQDTQVLTPQSDFKRFMAPGVDPEVKNAAMKKLFTDPHFNVMDRMDVYIDDYSIPDPLPQSMLRQMASAKFLNLFDDEEKEEKDRQPGAGLTPSPASAAQTDNPPTAAANTGLPPPDATAHLNDQDHVDPDLRLQQDHAAGPQGSGRGPQ